MVALPDMFGKILILKNRFLLSSGRAATGGAGLPREDRYWSLVTMSETHIKKNIKSFVRRNHTVGLNQWHLEWCPKYRYKCFKKEYITQEIERLIRQAAEEHRIIIHTPALNIDHVHLFVSLPFDMSPERALMLLKGRSAYLIFRRFPNFRRLYPKGHFWSKGNFARSISNVTSGAIKNYIENQQFGKLHETITQLDKEPSQLSLAGFL